MRKVVVFGAPITHRMVAGEYVEWVREGKHNVLPLNDHDMSDWVQTVEVERLAAPVWRLDRRLNGSPQTLYVAVHPAMREVLEVAVAGAATEQLRNELLREKSYHGVTEERRKAAMQWLAHYTDAPWWRRVWRALRRNHRA